MTREEALNLIQHKLDLAVDDALIMTDKEYESLSLCAKALEEQSTLDKIRAEIAVLDDADYDYEGYYKAVTDAVKIIDKYRK